LSVIDEEMAEFRAEARWVRTAPRKAQAVVGEIRGLSVADARTTLRFMTRAAARDVAKVLDSAVANAESHPLSSYDADSLYVAAAYVGAGPSLKRWRARARGRVGRIRKRTCHITVRLAPIPGAEVLTPPPAAEPARRSRRKAETEAPVGEAAVVGAAAATVEDAVEEAAAPVEEAPVEEAPPEKPKRARKPKPPAEAAEAEPAAEAVVEKPAAEEEEAVAETVVEEEPPAEEVPKRRSRSTKKPTAEAPAEEAPTAEEAPAEEKPKPARRSRKKTEDSSPEGDG
jgi:large subunit ribosomal protein L22